MTAIRWTCPGCGMVRFGHEDRCCVPRPAQGEPATEWTCTAGHRNKAEHGWCRGWRCGQPKPGTAGQRKNLSRSLI